MQREDSSVRNIVKTCYSFVTRHIFSFLYIFSYPVVKSLFRGVTVLFLTNVMYVVLKVLFTPVGLLHEEVYFDYLHKNGPMANLTLASMERQWMYARESDVSLRAVDCFESFLDRNTEYDVSLMFSLAKSHKNWDIGKCMVYLSVLDCKGQMVASSVRSLHLPYQSLFLLRIDSVLKLPLYLTNMLHEYETVQVNMMRGFRDMSHSMNPSHSLQVFLSREGSTMDIERCFINVEPRPTGISYMFYAFPIMSFLAINALFLSLFFTSSISLFVLDLLVPSDANKSDDNNADSRDNEFSDDTKSESSGSDDSGEIDENYSMSPEEFLASPRTTIRRRASHT